LNLVSQGGFLLSKLLEDYRALHPALHPLLDQQEIDTGALAYAVHRLPAEVTRTTFYFLTPHLPTLYVDPDEKFTPVSTRSRRRYAWQALPGKVHVLLRDGITDITDLLTCLCVYAVEARKIRRRCSTPELLRALYHVQQGDPAVTEDALVEMVHLSPEELAGLRAIWPEDFWIRFRDILTHHEDVALECDFQIDNYNASAAEKWVRQIREVAAKMVNLEDSRLQVHIISSNTHSVGNCLSAFVARRAEAILAWGRENHPELTESDWRVERDLIYALMRHYIDEVEGAYESCVQEERAAGHHRLRATAFTGIAVDLICAQQLDPSLIDPSLTMQRPENPVLIVNVDYAFGQQAEEILANLLFLFGRQVRSVNVLGKAGGLMGGRGDLMLPRATLLQTNDELYPLPNADLDAGLLQRMAGELPIHEGPVLTVSGTLLQNRQLLQFYRRIWKCVGLEMEGSYFARKLISAIEMGIVRQDVASRFAYYISDVPLDTDENLSARMTPQEGVPPLYAITRTILQQVFDQTRR
ncbi:MAG: hypothetical protein AAFV53_12860, partial [Myxococcota bacterium]